jgi:hypothetical protein
VSFRNRVLDALADVDTSGVADGDTLIYDEPTDEWLVGAGGGGGGAPTTADYVTGSAQGGLSAELVLGTSVLMTGTIAARPAASLAGRFYWASDIFALFRDTGAAWTTVGVIPGRLRSGRYYSPGSSRATNTPTLDQLNAIPIIIPRAVTLDRIAVEITTLGAAGAVVRLGCYTDNDGIPDALIADFGTVDATTTGVKEITISQTVNPGILWLARASQGATSAQRSFSETPFPEPADSAVPSGTSANTAYNDNGIAGALPANFTIDGMKTGNCPHVWIRAA